MGNGRYSDTQTDWPMPDAPGVAGSTDFFYIVNPGQSDGEVRASGIEHLGQPLPELDVD